MRVHLGSDHAGYEYKALIAARLGELGHEVVDHGPIDFDPDDDYPPFVMRAAAATVADPGSLAVVLGGSGNGEQIAANKVAGVRAALAWSVETATLAREHNDANVLSLGARQYPADEALAMVEAFVAAAFSENPRHARRIQMMSAYESSGQLPAMPPAAELASGGKSI